MLYPSRALYLLLPQLPTILSARCCQKPCDPSSCTTSAAGPHWGRTKTSRAASGTNPSGRSMYKGGNKPQLKPRGSVAKKEDPKPSHQLYKLQIKSTQSTKQTLCLWNIQRAIESSHRRKHTSSDSCGHWRQEHRRVGPGQNLSCPHNRSTDEHSVRRHPKEVRWTVTPNEGKDSDSSSSRKTFIILMF